VFSGLKYELEQVLVEIGNRKYFYLLERPDMEAFGDHGEFLLLFFFSESTPLDALKNIMNVDHVNIYFIKKYKNV